MSCRAEIAVYTLLGVLQSAASPALDTLAADPSFRAVAARAELTVPRLPSWAAAEGEEERLTRAVRFTVLREVAAAAAGRIAELAGEVEAGRLTVPAACELFAGELPDFGELAAEILARTAGEDVTAAKKCRSKNPVHCRVHGVPLKKTQPRYLGGIDPRHGREGESRKNTAKVYRLNRRKPLRKQVRDLARMITRASRDGENLQAVLYRPEFGELTLECGRPGRKNNPADSRGHGVQHALEERHHISPHDIAETLLRGKVRRDPKHETRLNVMHNGYVVVLERKLKQKRRRISKTGVKLITATKKRKK